MAKNIEQTLNERAKFIAGVRERDKEELVAKTKKRIQKLLKKGHSPAGAKWAAQEEAAGRTWGKPKKKKTETRRTQQVTEQLRSSLTEKDIARFKKK